MTKAETKPEGKQRKTQGTSAVEWLAASLGAVLLLAMVGYMSILGFNDVKGSPQIKLTTAPPIRRGAVYIVKFEAENLGNETASGLVIKAVLSRGNSELEKSELTIDYLPSGSVRSGGFFFVNDPTSYRLELAPVGYLDP